MPSVLNEYVGDGVSKSFNIAMEGGYLSRDYVKFYVRPLEALLDWTPLTNNEVTWTGDFSFTIDSAIPIGSVLVVFRETPLTPLVDFQNTSRITENNLDTATSQSIHIAAEASDTVGRIQAVAQDAKQESAQALAGAQAAAASADTAAASAIAASVAATVAQDAAIQAGADAEDAALSAATAAGVADAAALTANAANATANVAAADAAAALTSAGNANATANAAASQAGTAVSTANTAVSTANAASAAAGNAVTTANSAEATASAALTIANEAKDLVDEAVSGTVVSFNGRVGAVTPQAGDYTKSMVGLGDVDNTTDLGKPISTATSNALGLKADTTYVNTQLTTKLNLYQGAASVRLSSAEQPSQEGLFVFQMYGRTDVMPDNGWWSLLRVQHQGYPDGYWQDLALPFGAGLRPRVRQNVDGTKSQWQELAYYSDVSEAIASTTAFTSVPATFKAWEIVVMQPHLRKMIWSSTYNKYVRAPWHAPGQLSYFLRDVPAGYVEVRSDVVLNAADFPDLAAYLGVTEETFLLDEARGEFLRSLDSGRGKDAGRVLGSNQGDAGRSLIGRFSANSYAGASSGAFRRVSQGGATSDTGSGVRNLDTNFELDASLVWPVANEFRVTNRAYRLAVQY